MDRMFAFGKSDQKHPCCHLELSAFHEVFLRGRDWLSVRKAIGFVSNIRLWHLRDVHSPFAKKLSGHLVHQYETLSNKEVL